jgi:hypothetical protein
MNFFQIFKGDSPGHKFRGNQYVLGGGGAAETLARASAQHINSAHILAAALPDRNDKREYTDSVA